MRHVVADEWSRRPGFFQRRDPRVKVLCALAFVVAVSLGRTPETLAVLALQLTCALLLAQLPLGAFLLRAAAPLPFAIVFAAATALSGDVDRAMLLLCRSALSVTAMLLLAATTPMPRLLDALLWMRMPAALVEVIQFVYRYLFVLAEQLWRMRSAARSRAGTGSAVAAVSTVRVLFAQSFRRAENIHRAMLARGYAGGAIFPGAEQSITRGDVALVAATSCALAAAFAAALGATVGALWIR